MSYERHIKLENDKIKELVVKKGELVGEGRKLNEELEKMIDEVKAKEEILKGIATKVQKIKDKIIPLVDREMKDQEIGEFEVAMNTDIDGDDLRVSIVDVVEKYKEDYLAQVKDKVTSNK